MREATGCLMRHSLWFVALLALSSAAEAAVIAGRVVDGDGRPVAGAEVRVWQKLPGPMGQGVSDQPARFAEGDGGDVLRTDADGRFETPDVVTADAFARVFVDAEGMLTARGDWIEIRQETSPHVIQLAMRRLRTVAGQVLDRQQHPIEGATVFHVGDAPERIEAQSDRDGKFRLPDVPEGRVFVFAEKPGYRFTGILAADDRDAAFTLARTEEPIEPLKTLPPLFSHEEEIALARGVIEPALEAARSGTPEQKVWTLFAMAALDPLEAFDRAEAMDFHLKPHRDNLDHTCARLCVAGRANLSWDNLRTYIEVSHNHEMVAEQLCEAAARMGKQDRVRRLEWLDEALLHARDVENVPGRAMALANVADTFLQADQWNRAAEIIAEAEKGAEHLPPQPSEPLGVYRALALGQAAFNPQRAVEWLERIKNPTDYQRLAGKLAVRLLPDHPLEAEDVWKRAHDRTATLQGAMALPGLRYSWQIANVADLCYKLAQLDGRRAERLARGEAFAPVRIRGLGAVALAMSETDPAAARELLAVLVRDELARLDDIDATARRYLARPITTALLLPIAEQVDAGIARECFWRSLALRAPRPTHGDFNNEADDTEAELAKMLSRYDREAARVLLEPLAVRLPETAASGETTLAARHALLVAHHALQHAQDVVYAATFIDPRWAAELIARLPRSTEMSWRRPDDYALREFATVLGESYDERWTAIGGYWAPPEHPLRKHDDQARNDRSEGIGVALAQQDGKLFVGSVLPESPAAANGVLHAKDRIVAIGQGDETVSADTLSLEQAVAAIRGPRGSVVRLTIVPAGKEEDDAVVVSLTRGVVKELNLFGQGTKIKAGSKAPDLKYARLDDDKEERIADLNGKIVVVCFWASWCGPCKPLVEKLQALPAEKPGWGERVRVLALSVDEKHEAAMKVCQEHGWDKAQLAWCGPDALRVYDVAGLPGLFVIDAGGKIVAFDRQRKMAEVVDDLLDTDNEK